MEKTNQTLGREAKTNTSAHSHNQTPEREWDFLWINAINTRGKKKQKKPKDLLTSSICAHHDSAPPGYDAGEYCQTGGNKSLEKQKRS